MKMNLHWSGARSAKPRIVSSTPTIFSSFLPPGGVGRASFWFSKLYLIRDKVERKKKTLATARRGW